MPSNGKKTPAKSSHEEASGFAAFEEKVEEIQASIAADAPVSVSAPLRDATGAAASAPREDHKVPSLGSGDAFGSSRSDDFGANQTVGTGCDGAFGQTVPDLLASLSTYGAAIDLQVAAMRRIANARSLSEVFEAQSDCVMGLFQAYLQQVALAWKTVGHAAEWPVRSAGPVGRYSESGQT